MSDSKFYSKREEKANYLSHAFGVIIAIVGTAILISKAYAADNKWAILAHSIFGFGMLVCMLSSTIYHYVQQPKIKTILRHLITQVFMCLLLLVILLFHSYCYGKRECGDGLFILVWLIAIVGIGFNLRPMKKNSHLKTGSYVLMGMTIIIAIKPTIRIAVENNCLPVLYWLAAGGVFYIIGSVIYALAKREFAHSVFHVFVLLGLGSHILSAYLIPV